MSEAEQNAEILDALEKAGLAETYVDEDGRQVMRLTDEGAAMAAEHGILEHGPDVDTAEGAPTRTEPESLQPLEIPGTFGTAVGAAMLGFEQALRREPPPEVLAAEHMPERDLSTDDGEEVVIEFPDPIERG